MRVRSLVAVLIVAALVAIVVGTSFASNTGQRAPCWEQLLNEAYSGRIYSIFPVRCYTKALAVIKTDKHLPGITAELRAIVRLADQRHWLSSRPVVPH